MLNYNEFNTNFEKNKPQYNYNKILPPANVEDILIKHPSKDSIKRILTELRYLEKNIRSILGGIHMKSSKNKQGNRISKEADYGNGLKEELMVSRLATKNYTPEEIETCVEIAHKLIDMQPKQAKMWRRYVKDVLCMRYCEVLQLDENNQPVMFKNIKNKQEVVKLTSDELFREWDNLKKKRDDILEEKKTFQANYPKSLIQARDRVRKEGGYTSSMLQGGSYPFVSVKDKNGNVDESRITLYLSTKSDAWKAVLDKDRELDDKLIKANKAFEHYWENLVFPRY